MRLFDARAPGEKSCQRSWYKDDLKVGNDEVDEGVTGSFFTHKLTVHTSRQESGGPQKHWKINASYNKHVCPPAALALPKGSHFQFDSIQR